MEISPKKFRQQLNDGILELHWRHWTTLGVESYVEPESSWLIDLESLTLSTLVVGLDDKRLISSAIEWLAVNSEWVNISRLSGLAKSFARPVGNMDKPLFDRNILVSVVNFMRKIRRNREENQVDEKNMSDYYLGQQPELLQLHLRALFGIDAHVEVFTYLLLNEGGNSNSIANEVHHDQKNVYKVPERWTEAGIVSKLRKGRANHYQLVRKKRWVDAVAPRGSPKYVNWGKVFLLLHTARKIVLTKPWRYDDYLISSFFRDIHSDLAFMNSSSLDVKP